MRVRDHRVAGDARRHTLTGPELFGIGEPGVHPFVQILCGALPIPAAVLSRGPLGTQPAGGESHEEHTHNDGDGQPHRSGTFNDPRLLLGRYPLSTTISHTWITCPVARPCRPGMVVRSAHSMPLIVFDDELSRSPGGLVHVFHEAHPVSLQRVRRGSSTSFR